MCYFVYFIYVQNLRGFLFVSFLCRVRFVSHFDIISHKGEGILGIEGTQVVNNKLLMSICNHFKALFMEDLDGYGREESLLQSMLSLYCELWMGGGKDMLEVGTCRHIQKETIYASQNIR